MQCRERQSSNEKALNFEWLNINNETANKELISCITVTDLKNLDELLYAT
jgi:hypothetical protein